MANPFPRDRLMSVDEYFAFEEASAEKHEYVDGQVHAMSGATREHSRIAGNIFARLWAVARGGPCRVHRGEVKLHVGKFIYYPDVMVVCSPVAELPSRNAAAIWRSLVSMNMGSSSACKTQCPISWAMTPASSSSLAALRSPV